MALDLQASISARQKNLLVVLFGSVILGGRDILGGGTFWVAKTFLVADSFCIAEAFEWRRPFWVAE